MCTDFEEFIEKRYRIIEQLRINSGNNILHSTGTYSKCGVDLILCIMVASIFFMIFFRKDKENHLNI